MPEQNFPDTGTHHEIFQSHIMPPFSDNTETVYLGGGCFWGLEELFWQLPGVTMTAVGYMGGHTENPTYQKVCTGNTGHAETVLVNYDPKAITAREIFEYFFQFHDPTQGDRQGNDIGSQYRSAIFVSSDQLYDLAVETRTRYQKALTSQQYGTITTEIRNSSDQFFYAETYHQQYLHKVPYGYRCHGATGIGFQDTITV